jgi:hypothetical protein
MNQQAGSRGRASKLLSALSSMGESEDNTVGQSTHHIPQFPGPATGWSFGQDISRLFDAQIAALLGPDPAPFSLPLPDDMGNVDQKIAELAAEPGAQSLPAYPSLPCPQLGEHATVGPPLTRQICDAFTMCYAFFKLGGGAPNGVLRNTLLGVPYLADEHLKRAFWDFFSYYWTYLDDVTRRWIIDTPLVWEQIQSRDRQGENLDPFERKKLSDYYGRNFEWFEDALRQHQAR